MVIQGEFEKKFGRRSKISIRKRKKFIDQMTMKVSKQFGKDILCLLDFNKQGLVTWVLPAHTESTHKGKLVQSFSLPQVFYTTHCVNRFSERMKINDNCVIQLDALLNEAILSFGENQEYLTCSDGVFAYELEKDRLVIKTYLNFELLSDDQIKQFYGPGMISMLPLEYTADHISGSDFIIENE